MGHSLEEDTTEFHNKDTKKGKLWRRRKNLNSKGDCRTHVLMAATDVGETLKKKCVKLNKVWYFGGISVYYVLLLHIEIGLRLAAKTKSFLQPRPWAATDATVQGWAGGILFWCCQWTVVGRTSVGGGGGNRPNKPRWWQITRNLLPPEQSRLCPQC
jgi:hypothetical protein